MSVFCREHGFLLHHMARTLQLPALLLPNNWRLELCALVGTGMCHRLLRWLPSEAMPLHPRPLELFDNLDYELYDPEEWVELGEEDGVSCRGHATLQL